MKEKAVQMSCLVSRYDVGCLTHCTVFRKGGLKSFEHFIL